MLKFLRKLAGKLGRKFGIGRHSPAIISIQVQTIEPQKIKALITHTPSQETPKREQETD